MSSIFLLSIFAIFETSTYQNGDIGLKIDLPEGAIVSEAGKTPPFCIVSNRKGSDNWDLRLERGINPNASNAEELLQIPGGLDAASTIVSEELISGDTKGWLSVISNNSPDQLRGTIVRFAIPADGQQFIVGTLLTDLNGWNRNEQMLRAVFSSMRSVDPISLIQAKLDALDNAKSLLDSLNEDSLRKILGFEEWRRVQSKDENGEADKDIGYAYIRVNSGRAEDVEGKNRSMEQNTGILITVNSRLVPKPETGVVIDSVGRYWMSWDGMEEQWSNEVTRWAKEVRATESEIGIRKRPELGAPRSRLMVIKQDQATGVVKSPVKLLAASPWLPRPLHFILGPILASEDPDQSYNWNTYENRGNAQQALIRIDKVIEQPDGSRLILTRYGELSHSLWTHVDNQGQLISQDQRGGVLVTGTTRAEMQRLWEPQNLW